MFQVAIRLAVVLITAPSLVLCHGHQLGTKYFYSYTTSMVLNNNDHIGKEPVGFHYEGDFVVETTWEQQRDYLLKISFGSSTGGHFLTRKKERKWGIGYLSENEVTLDKDFPLYAHIRDDQETQELVSFYYHKDDPVIASNLKKAIALLLRTKRYKEDEAVTLSTSGQEQTRTYRKSNYGKKSSPESTLAPETTDEWTIRSKLSRDHAVVTESEGWQNVSFISRMYEEAYSKLHLKFHLKLTKEEATSEKSKLSSAKSPSDIKAILGSDFIHGNEMLRHETHRCHNCVTLTKMVSTYSDFLASPQIATIPSAISYLKIVEQIRSGGSGASYNDLMDILKKNKDDGSLSSILDILAGAMTDASVSAALDFLNLPSNNNLDLSERLLVTLSVAYLTTSLTGTDPSPSSHEFIINKLRKALETRQWSSSKLRMSAFICIGTILRARDQLSKKQAPDEFTEKVMKEITSELENCKETECKIALIYAIRNAGNLQLSLDALERIALNYKEKQESIAAMKAIRDCLDHTETVDQLTLKKLMVLAPTIAFDEKHETTSRIVASEIIMKHLDDTIKATLVHSIAHFENYEMTTMMWARTAQKTRSQFSNALNNWLLHSTRLNGTSTSYRRLFGGTKAVNASYMLTMEQLTKGNLLKESAFDVDFSDEKGNVQHIVTVGLFARGLESFVGGTSEEDATAGMALKILNVQLRRNTFFTGTGELMGHVWSGSGSEMTNAFRGNFLVVDNTHSHPLVNGFTTEHRLRGVLSLDLSGEIQISLWNKNSHSVVRTSGTLLVQGSQNIFTGDNLVSVQQQFSYGGALSMDFVTDIDFYSSPYKMCMQVVQPSFKLRHNTRKYEKLGTSRIDRRIHRRTYTIGAKSFALHKSNSEMCAAMHRS